jgi:hypothetical protein
MDSPNIAATLSIGPGDRVWFSPIEYLWLIGPLPPNVPIVGDFGAATVAVIFLSNVPSVRWFVDRYRTVMTRPRELWVCCPTVGRADFNRRLLESTLAGHGLRAVREVALGSDWTALSMRYFQPGQQVKG